MVLVAACVVLKGDRALVCWRTSPHPQGRPLEWLGGKAEPTDKSLAHTAARELREEVGILVDPTRILPFGRIFHGSVNSKTYSVQHFLVPQNAYQGEVQLRAPVHKGHWWWTRDDVRGMAGSFLPSGEFVMAELPTF